MYNSHKGNNVLTRKPTEWSIFEEKTNMKQTLLFTLFFLVTCMHAQVIVINEVDADNPGTDTQEFVELKTSTANMALDGYVVVLYNGSSDVSYNSFDLDGYSSDANGLFVLGTSGVSPTPDYVFSATSNAIQNGADAIAVYQDDATNFPKGTAVTTTNMIDAFVYDTKDADDTGLLSGLGKTVQYNEGEGGDKDHQSNQRKEDGTYETKEPTPGVLNNGGGVVSPTITISTSQTSYNEGDDITLHFTTSENVASDLILNYTLVNGAFTASDYTGNLSVTISAGNASANVVITIVDDSENEGNETIIVKYNNLDGSYKATNDSYAISILDDDYTTSNYGTPLNPTYGNVHSTAPGNYYQSLNGLSGQDLKDAITAIISNSSTVRAQTYGDVWDILKEADENPANNNEVWLLYSEIGRAKTEQQGSGSSIGKWNREHIYPQSRGGFSGGTSTSADGKEVYMTTDATHTKHGHGDAHSLRPADSSENTRRSNKDYGEEYNGPDGNKGSWKGDIARSLMYMSLRYDALDVVNGNPDNSTEGQIGDLTYLLTWNSTDIPDDYEMHRNNVIYDWQKNRNPFIDLPKLAEYVFGDKTNSTYNVSTSIPNQTVDQVEYFPNPVIGTIHFPNVSNGTLTIYGITGSLEYQAKMTKTSVDLSMLDKGLYFFKIQSANTTYNGKFVKK